MVIVYNFFPESSPCFFKHLKCDFLGKLWCKKISNLYKKHYKTSMLNIILIY